MSTAVADLDALASEHDATISVWLGGLDHTPWLTRLPDQIHHAASTMKLPLIIAVHREVDAGRLSLDDELLVEAHLPSVVEGTTYETTEDYDNDKQPWGVLGQQATIGWLAERAIIKSSNLATNLLITKVGMAAVNRVYADVGAERAALRRPIQDRAGGELGLDNEATAADMAAVLVALSQGELLSAESTRAVEDILARCETNEQIPPGLPEGTYIAHKTGWIDHACHDAAIVRPEGEVPFVLTVYCTAPMAEDPIHALVADVARICWRDHDQLREAAGS
ncbi:MAG: serine hydrolase [Propionibacteriaceae bacterium]